MIFIPNSCQWIDDKALSNCSQLIILSIPKYARLGQRVIECTALIKASPFNYITYGKKKGKKVNGWLKTRHVDNAFSLHRICSSESLHQSILEIVKEKGLQGFKEMLEETDEVGITLLQYLSSNPYTEINQHIIINHYILNMLSELA